MKTLFIDSHSSNFTVALIMDNQVYEINKISDRSHSEIAIDSLVKLLNKGNITLQELNQIIVVVGPGSFTGVRIGVTIAKTIAYSFNIPIKQITSLEAFGVSDNSKFDIITVEDSKGIYSAIKKDNKFTSYEYRRKKEFENFIIDNSYIVSQNKSYDYKKIQNYIKNKEFCNPHSVNPIYIKEIDVLK